MSNGFGRKLIVFGDILHSFSKLQRPADQDVSDAIIEILICNENNDYFRFYNEL